jgi:hypothetical protein
LQDQRIRIRKKQKSAQAMAGILGRVVGGARKIITVKNSSQGMAHYKIPVDMVMRAGAMALS